MKTRGGLLVTIVVALVLVATPVALWAQSANELYLAVVLRGEEIPPTPTASPTATSQPSVVPPTLTPTPTNTPGPSTAVLVIDALSGTTEPEFVTIRNTSAVPQDMTGWSIVSVVGPQTYIFPAGYVLEAGASVRVESWRSAINNPPTVLLWTDAAIWLNSGDAAELRNAGGVLVDTECYGSNCP